MLDYLPVPNLTVNLKSIDLGIIVLVAIPHVYPVLMIYHVNLYIHKILL